MTAVQRLLADVARFEAPEGWKISTSPGWNPNPFGSDVVGEGHEPAGAVRGDEIIDWAGRKFPGLFVTYARQLAASGDGVSVTLYMMLSTEHEVRVCGAFGGGELTEALKTLLGVRPLDWWKTKALLQLSTQLEGDLPGVQGDDLSKVTLPDAAKWLRAILVPASTSQQRRNNRVTPSLLREVAEVYRAATEAGRPPTVEVAEHFNVSRANAAKWVGRAREQRFLGPALGPVAGEGPVDG